MPEIAEVAVGLPIRKTFHYLIPERMKDLVQVGMRILIPFKDRKVTGFTIDLTDDPPEGIEKLQEIEELLDESPVIPPRLLRFYRWTSDYYLYPLGEVIKTGLPPGLDLKSEQIMRLTPLGEDFLAKGALDPLQKEIFQEVAKRGDIRIRKLLKIFPEVTRTVLYSWKRKGFLQFDLTVNGGEIRPKFEKKIQYHGGEAQGLSRKQFEVLKRVEAAGELLQADLNRHFKSLSTTIRSLQKKGLISVVNQEVCRDSSLRSELSSYSRPEVTPAQERVLAEILKGVHSNRYAPFLIHGVTGSGKTEIYLQAIEKVVGRGKEAIVLVPEISLTPQLISRFTERFGKNLSVLHSKLGRGERYDQWRKIWKGSVKIVIGARSAIFAPFNNVGIIVVDEEHDPSYKQEDKLRYHARDLAVVRAKQGEAVLLLGSATPSLESFHNTTTGKFHLLSLPERIGGRPLPRVEVVDLRGEKGLLSDGLRTSLQKNIENKKQSLLFLNRRGFANFILCPDCGFTFKCPNCSLTLTHHIGDRSLQCHYCDYWIRAPGDCPKCGGHGLRGMGIGTERLEQEIRSSFPHANVGRMDRDTTKRKSSHQQILKSLESGRIDILVGTQMIVKGHDFPNVTFVGVVSADTSLHFPDFRSSERTFQLLTQAAGRAGRGEALGKVVVQTYNPDHYSIQRAKDHDFIGFYNEEIPFRRSLDYPPFSRFINFRLAGNGEKKTETASGEMGRIGKELLKEGYGKWIEILGPSAAPVAKMKGKFRWQMLAKGKSSKMLHNFTRDLSHLMDEKTRSLGVNLEIDVDPVFVL